MLIAVDFDGTIVEHAYPAIGKPIPFAIDVLKKFQEDGHEIVLWTFRTGEMLDQAVNYCREKGLEFYAVNKMYPEEEWSEDGPRKIDADIFIDDKNLLGLPDWGEIYRIVKFGNNEHASYDGNNPDNVLFKVQKNEKKSFLSKLFK